MRRRLIDIIAPNAKNISFCIFISLLFWYDIFLPNMTDDIAAGNITVSVYSPLALLLSLLMEDIFFPDVVLWKITGFFLYLLLCFMLLRLNEVFSFIRVRTILPFLFCLITGGLLLRPHSFSSGIIVALLVLLAVFSSFKLLTEENPKYAFNVSLLLFTAALFSFSCVWLLIVFWLFAYASNVFSFRVFLASLLGAFMPVLYAFIGFWIAGSEDLLWAYIQDSFRLFAVNFHFSSHETIYLISRAF